MILDLMIQAPSLLGRPDLKVERQSVKFMSVSSLPPYP